MARFKRILEPGEQVALRLPTARDRWRSALLLGVGFPALAVALRFLMGMPPVSDLAAIRDAAIYVFIGSILALVQYWRGRLRIAVTPRRVLVRRGRSWSHFDQMPLAEIGGIDYDMKTKTMLVYGNRRVLEIPCSLMSQVRIVVAVDKLK